jgi:hypothetical protein
MRRAVLRWSDDYRGSFGDVEWSLVLGRGADYSVRWVFGLGVWQYPMGARFGPDAHARDLGNTTAWLDGQYGVAGGQCSAVHGYAVWI